MTYRRVLKAIILLVILTLMISTVGCKDKKESILDPNDPTIINVWHYYNGDILKHFDELVREFNETMGSRLGIVVESNSFGGVTQLETEISALTTTTSGKGKKLPNIFSVYPDKGYEL